MRDDAHKTISLGELIQDIQRAVQHIVAEGAEALIDKQSLHLPAARVVLHHIG